MPRWDINFDLKINLDDRELLDLYVEIESYKRSISKIPLPPSLAKRIDKLNIIRQIKGTTGIEGNTLTEDEIEIVIDSASTKSAKVEEQEAINSHELLQFIKNEVKRNNSHIISEELIRNIHYISTKDCNYNNSIPGRYRDIDVSAGEYRAPDHNHVPELMSKFIEFINRRDVIECCTPLIRSIIAHFYLVSIHPFGDGNGRTSRGLEAYILYQGNFNIRGFYSLSNFFYKNRNEYINELQAARFVCNGDLTRFVKFSLRGYVDELNNIQEEVLSFVKAILFKDYINELLLTEEINFRISAVLEYMINESREITVDEYRSKKHYFIRSLYENIKTEKTILRDLEVMREKELIVIENKLIKANIDIMNKFE